MKNRKHCLQRKILTTSLLAPCALLLASCKFYYLSMLDQFKKYTEDITVSSMQLDSVYPYDSENVVCVPSGSYQSATVYITNPLLLSVDTTVSLPEAAISLAGAAGIDTSVSSNLYTVALSSDRTYLRLEYTDRFLDAVDGNSGLVDPDGTARQNDITPTFTFSCSNDAAKMYGPFTPLSIRCNSRPCAVTDAVVMQKTTAASTEGKYVLFFNLPEMTGAQKDITTLTISSGDTPLSFAVTPAGPSTKAKLAAADDGTSGLYSSWDSSAQGTLSNVNGATVAERTYPVYFDTGMTADHANHSFIITLTDSMALSTAVTANSVTPMLKEATCSNTGTTLAQDDGSAYATVIWTAPSEATYTGEDGSIKTKAVDATHVTLTYSLFLGHDANVLTAQSLISATQLSPYSASIPHGEYTVSVVASLDGCISSTVTTNITVEQTTAYVYATPAGTLANGSKENPYTTVTAALSNMTDPSNAKNKIILCSDVADTVSLSNAELTIASDDEAAPRTITGSSPASTIALTSGALTLSSIQVEGKTSAASAVSMDASSSCTISGATTLSRAQIASGAYLTIGGTLTAAAATDGDIATPVAVIVPEAYTDTSFTRILLKTVTGTLTEDTCDLFTVANDSNGGEYFIAPGSAKSNASDAEKTCGYLQKLQQSCLYSQANGLSGSDFKATTRFICDAGSPVTYVLSLPKGKSVSANDESGTALTPETVQTTYLTTYTFTLPKPVTAALMTLSVTDASGTASAYEFIYGGVAYGAATAGTEKGTALHPFTDFNGAYSTFGSTAHSSTANGTTTSFDIIYLVSDVTISNTIEITPTIPFTFMASASGTTITQTSTAARALKLNNSSNVLITLDGITITGGSAGNEGGGGIYYYSGNGTGTLVLNNVTVKGNSASIGGGIYSMSGIIFLTGASSVTGNTSSSSYGGGIYIDGGMLTISGNSSVSSNTAATCGGGIAATNGVVHITDSATVTGNTAKDGGGLYAGGGTFVLTTGGVSGNTATNQGTQLSAASGTIYLGGNAALRNAGATDETHPSVFLAGGQTLTITSALTAAGTAAVIQPESYPATTPITVVQGNATYTPSDADIGHLLAANDTSGNTWSINSAGQLYRSAAISVAVASGIATATFSSGSGSVTKGSAVAISATKDGSAVNSDSLTVLLNGTTLTSTANTALGSAKYESGTLTVPLQPGVYSLTISFTDGGVTYSTHTTLTVIQ